MIKIFDVTIRSVAKMRLVYLCIALFCIGQAHAQTGFEVANTHPTSSDAVALHPNNSPNAEIPAVDGAIPIRYIVDRVGEFYLIKLLAGREILSRAYVIKADKVVPAGAWSLLRQEQ